MKRFPLFFIAFALIGAGCAQSVTTTSSNSPTVSPSPDTELNSTSTIDVTIDDSNTVSEEDSESITEKSLEGDQVEGSDEDTKLQAKVVQMESGNFFFDPASITVESGQDIQVIFQKNSGVHTLVIDEIGLKVPIKEGKSTTFTADLPPGTYAFYCDVGNHRALGMEGVLIVK